MRGKIKQLSPDEALYKLAAFCSSSERCLQDVRKKLIVWEIPEIQQEVIIKRLQKEHFLDEERFCRAYVNDKIKFNHWGNNKVKYELVKKGISEKTINNALEAMNQEETREILIQLLAKKRLSIKAKNEFEAKNKLVRFAIGRGFPLNEINYCMKKLFDDYEDLLG
jgi:regulatory protein